MDSESISYGEWLSVKEMVESQAWKLVMEKMRAQCDEGQSKLRNRVSTEDYHYWCGFLDAQDTLMSIIEDIKEEAQKQIEE